MNEKITILTPSYNRAHTLPNLYKSLLLQDNQNFEWLIVDDGSKDNTKELVNSFCKDEKIKITYLFQKNGGKHSAINTGIKKIKNSITFIVDSDDVLTEDAISSIYKYWPIVVEKNLIGISFLRGYSVNKAIGDEFPKQMMIENFNKIRYKSSFNWGDKAEVVSTLKLRETPFPIYEGENFMSEGVVWKQLARKGDSLLVSQIIYITEYLEDGLTKSGRRLLLNNPLGAMLNSKLAMTKEFEMKVRIKNTMLYVAYGFFAKKTAREIVIGSNQNILTMAFLPFGWGIYRFWRKKYEI